jgi:signal transduction histidine kinase
VIWVGQIVAQIPAKRYLRDTAGRHLRIGDEMLTDADLSEEEVLGRTDVELYVGVARETYEDDLQVVETDATAVVSESDVQIRADAGLLHQSLENLLGNAVEHGSTSPDSQARQDAVEHGGEDTEVRVGALSDRAGFYVADDGHWIPPDERDRVFDAGYSTSESGTGFGLSIVESHDWKIRVDESADGGARLGVTAVDVGSVD